MNGAEAACQQKRQGGYTIIEVLIVLVVTMALFASAVAAVSGRESRVEFTQAVNDVKGALEQSINQVGSGYYADIGGLNTKTCLLQGGVIGFSATTTEKGASGGCTFLGQAIEFGITNGGRSGYASYTIAGLRSTSTGGEPVSSLSQAKPMLVYPANNATLTYPDSSNLQYLKNGLSVLSMKYNGHDIGGFALMSDVGSYDGGLLSSGTQALKLYPLLPVTMGAPTYTSALPLKTVQQTFAQKVDANLAGLNPDVDANPASGIQICLVSGGTNQSALLTIGGANRALAVNMLIKPNRTCS